MPEIGDTPSLVESYESYRSVLLPVCGGEVAGIEQVDIVYQSVLVSVSMPETSYCGPF